MKPLVRNVFSVEADGVTFTLRAPTAAQTLALRRLLPTEEAQDTAVVARQSALIVAYLWDPASEHGSLDCAAGLPPLGTATIEELAAAGDVVLAEMSDAGMSLTTLTALFIAGVRRMFGADLAEGGKAATFTGARPG